MKRGIIIENLPLHWQRRTYTIIVQDLSPHIFIGDNALPVAERATGMENN